MESTTDEFERSQVSAAGRLRRRKRSVDAAERMLDRARSDTIPVIRAAELCIEPRGRNAGSPMTQSPSASSWSTS